jgi:hypothetical protein
MSLSPKDLAETALRLRNSNPEGWDQFVASFAAYTDHAVLDVTAAGSDNVLVLQGQARQCLALLRTFRECDKKPKQPAPQ